MTWRGDVLARKDPTLAAVLGFLFGGFGLFYVSAAQGCVALATLLTIGFCTGGVGAIPVWIGCAAWGYIAAENYNKKMDAFLLEDEEIASFKALPPADGSIGPRAPQASGGGFCTQCGGPLKANAKFCGGCGTPTS